LHEGKTMTCLKNNKEGADILIEYLAGTLDPARQAALERHAAECPECRGLLGVWTTLDEFKAPEVSPDFDARLYARIAAEKSAPWWRRLLWPAGPIAWWKPAIPVAACAALAVALIVRGPAGGPADGNKQAKVEPVSMEQVEQALEDLELLAPVPAQGAQPAAL
jgi:anti-sigma factor RsiW